MRKLFQVYVKLLLPYECHLKHLNIADCLAKVDSSVYTQNVKSVPSINHEDGEGMDELDEIIQGGKVNGEAAPLSEKSSGRLNSQTSESSTGEISSHDADGTCMQAPSHNEKEQPDIVLPESQSSFPQDMSSDEPLPEISAQETESLLAMPLSPYRAPTQPPVSTGGPSTPSAGQITPPSSFPPPYPPHGSQDWGPPSGQEMFPTHGYPPSYSMDPSSYCPPSHPPQMLSGYHPYNTPTQHDVPMDYHLDMASPMMRSPYDASPYHVGMSPAMHGVPGARHSPYFLRSPMMSRQDPYAMRANDMYQGAAGMTHEWAWQQGRYPTMMHHHGMQASSRPSSAMLPSRLHMSQSGHPTAHHRTSANQSPGPISDMTKQHIQDQVKQAQSRTSEKPPAPSKSSKHETSSKTGPSKTEHGPVLDSLKRPLPDWSGCVEGTKPVLSKRRHLLSMDCGKLFSQLHICV